MAERRGRRRARIALALAGGLVALAAAGGALAWSRLDHSLARGRTEVAGLAPGPAVKDQPYNVLLVGTYRDAGLTDAQKLYLGTGRARDDSGRSDTMLLAHVSPARHRVVLLSLPRDLEVDVPGFGTGKLNGARAHGGPGLLVRTVTELTGLPVAHYVELDFAGFVRLIEVTGPVELCNPTGQRWNDVERVRGRTVRWTSLDLGPHSCMRAGSRDALAYVRARHVAGGDGNRMLRQQLFLRAVTDELASAGTLADPARLLRAADALGGSLHTDSGLSTTDALRLARQLGSVDGGDLVPRTLPSRALPRACPTCPDYLGVRPEAKRLLAAIRRDAATIPETKGAAVT
jgi:LCP family protein required for cell wall assembly